jgi:hypothetical protein
MTYDSIDDTIILSIHIKDWTLPAEWGIKINSLGKTIYQIKHNDIDIDSGFHDTLFMQNCKDYINCKKTWYKIKFNNFIGEMKDGEKRGGGSYEIYPHLVAQYIKEDLNISNKNAIEIADRLKTFFKKRKIVFFEIPYTPDIYSRLMTWEVQSKMFVPWFGP